MSTTPDTASRGIDEERRAAIDQKLTQLASLLGRLCARDALTEAPSQPDIDDLSLAGDES